jgi:hypothetical protein
MSFGPSTSTVQATQFDPLYPGSGGSDVRNDVYTQRAALSPVWNSRAATASSGLVTQASSPLWGQSFNMFSDQINGKYLGGSPQLTDQINTMRAQSAREAGDQQADITSRYARTGNSLSTGVNQQLTNTGAAARARSDATQAGIIGQNYTRERDFQNRSVQNAEYSANVPSNLLTQANAVGFDPLAKSAQLAMQLSGGGQVAAPDVIQKPGVLDYALGAASALG